MSQNSRGATFLAEPLISLSTTINIHSASCYTAWNDQQTQSSSKTSFILSCCLNREVLRNNNGINLKSRLTSTSYKSASSADSSMSSCCCSSAFLLFRSTITEFRNLTCNNKEHINLTRRQVFYGLFSGQPGWASTRKNWDDMDFPWGLFIFLPYPLFYNPIHWYFSEVIAICLECCNTDN